LLSIGLLAILRIGKSLLTGNWGVENGIQIFVRIYGGDLVSTGNQVFRNACRIRHLSRKDGGEN
jgi:hypothetical protein